MTGAKSSVKTSFEVEEIDPPRPARLYRYTPYSADKLRLLLTGNQIRFSDPNFFSDPFDCRTNMALPTVPNDVEFWATTVVNCLIRDGLLHRVEHDAKLAELIADDDKLYYEVEKLNDRVTMALRERFRVLCLCESGTDPLMWSLYADSHRGMCFEFDTAHFPFNRAEDVDYNEVHPDFDYVDDSSAYIPTFFWKAKYWEHEHEWRVLASDMTSSHNFIAHTAGYVMVPHAALTAIICGGQMNDAHVLETHAIARASLPDIPIKYCDLVRSDRSVRLEEILSPETTNKRAED